MPPRRPVRQARSSGYDPTVSISAASSAKPAFYNTQDNSEQKQENKKQGTNDELKKLIESLKNKLNSGSDNTLQKQVPPQPKAKTIWNRSVAKKETNFKPAYSILTRISNHEKVPSRSTKAPELTTKILPDSFIFRPGADGIEIDKKLKIQAGKQLCLG